MPLITPSMKALAWLGAEVPFRELTEHLTKLQRAHGDSGVEGAEGERVSA